MPNVLLVSQCNSPALNIARIIDSIPNLSFRITESLPAARSQLQNENIAVVLVHATEETADREILQFLQSAGQSTWPGSCLILADSYNNHQAFSALQVGAVEYLDTIFDLGKLKFLLEVLTAHPDGKCAPLLPPARQNPFLCMATPNGEMLQQIKRVAPQDTTLLLTGETGTGKTRLARFIHDLSPRHDQPFIVVDCATLSTTLIESEFFGHVRGAFTGADRNRDGKFATVGAGTLVLDEINALPLALQCKLLRVVDERVFEPVGSNQEISLQARLIAVSNLPLDKEVKAGKFRSDLYYRLRIVELYLPPLRERRSAIVALCQRFLAEFTSRNRPDITGMDPEVLQVLQQYRWSGNIRELRNVVERAVALAKGPLIALGDLPPAVLSSLSRNDASPRPELERIIKPLDGGTLHEAREEMEIRWIHAALKKHGNNRLQAAAELGISRMGLYKKLHKYGLIATGKTI